MQKQLKTYFKEIKKNLPCYNTAMRKMLNDLRLSVDTYIKDNNVTDFEKIIEHFGTAEDIAKEFAVGIDNSFIKSYKIKKRVITIVISILTVIMIAISTLVIYIIVDTQRNLPIDIDATISCSEEK